MFEVEKDVPLMRKPREENGGIPFEKLAEKGDSFFIPETAIAAASVRVAANRYRKKMDIRLTVQAEPGGCRVHRL